MKTKWLYLLPLAVFFSFTQDLDDNEPDISFSEDTGMVLDSMDNKVMLYYENGFPEYYYSEIFTPVCNTGECLPVKINLYWDLDGNYKKFDQPEGEILTKLDHEPFTEEDYDLLDDILHDHNDPRMSAQVKHYKGSQDANHSSPAPGAVRILTKYEMVDGVSGSTLPEIKDRFVPGALYTTYTIWGLAHDKQYELKNYTNFNLVKPKYYEHFLTSGNNSLSDKVMYQLLGNREVENPWVDVCVDLLDTGTVTLQGVALQKLHWDHYELEEVQEGMTKVFLRDSSILLKRMLCSKWEVYGASEATLLLLTAELSKNADVIEELALVYSESDITEAVFQKLITAIAELPAKSKSIMIATLEGKKDSFTSKQWKEVKALK